MKPKISVPFLVISVLFFTVGLFMLLVNPVLSQERVHAQERIYGSQLMTQEERDQFREKMRAAKTAEERELIRKEHHEQMKARAKERGVTLPDEPPARDGSMHRGGGMGPSGGMGPGGGGRGY